MAVIVQYVVVRDGKEDMIFTTKKEADAYDRMLDIAERLGAFLHTSGVAIDPDTLDALAFFMAQHGEQVSRLLRGGSLEAPVDHAPASKQPAEQPEEPTEPLAVEDPSQAIEADPPKSARAARAKASA